MESELFRPMRAYKKNFDPKAIRYPVLISPKYDGIQALLTRQVNLQSRTLTPIANAYARKLFEDARLIGCQGELIAGEPTAPDVMSRTQSAVMSVGTVDKELKFYLFDNFLKMNVPYSNRLMYLLGLDLPKNVIVVEQRMCKTPKEVMELEEKYCKMGFEGIMGRDPGAHYKQGRATLTGQELMKLKRFEDSEAEVLEVEERLKNENEATIDARGYTKRSKRAEGMKGAGMFGRAKVRDIHTGCVFYLGAGPYLTLARRIALWQPRIRRRLPGQIWKYRFQPSGMKDAPRFCRVLGPRDPRDIIVEGEE